MITTHKGICKFSKSDDWSVLLEHEGATMKALHVSLHECDVVVVFVFSLKQNIVEV